MVSVFSYTALLDGEKEKEIVFFGQFNIFHNMFPVVVANYVTEEMYINPHFVNKG